MTIGTIDIAARTTSALTEALSVERDSLPSEALPLCDELTDLVTAGGKRLRPTLVYQGWRAGGGAGDDDRIFRIGAAIEILHTFALIQDDVMDASAQRRGRPSTIAKLSADLGPRTGASAAVLTGLLGFVLADRMFYGAPFDPEAMARAREHFDRMRLEAIAGQYLDVTARSADVTTARRIAELKTGSYTVVGPLCVGAALATPDDAVIAVLTGFGSPFGAAFQIHDDVMSVFGDPAITGKDTDADLRADRPSVLLALAREQATPERRAVLDACLGRDELSVEDAGAVRGAIEASGARTRAEELIAELTRDALEALGPPLEPDAVAALRRVADETLGSP